MDDIQRTDIAKHFSLFPTDKLKLIDEFSKPIYNNVFFMNYNHLRDKSDLVRFDVEKWYMRPEVFCQDHYESFHFYQVVLLVNNIKSVFDFIPDNFIDRIIVAPHYQTIIRLLSQVIYT